MSVEEMVMDSLSMRGGFNPEALPSPDTVNDSTKDRLLQFAQKITPDSPQYSEALYDRLKLRLRDREGPIKELATYINETYTQAPKFAEEINALPFKDSTIGEEIPLEGKPSDWLRTNIADIYEDWVNEPISEGRDFDRKIHTFYTILAYFKGNNLPISFRGVSQKNKEKGAIKFKKELPRIRTSDFSILSDKRFVTEWEKIHPESKAEFTFNNLTRTYFDNLPEARRTVLLTTLEKVIEHYEGPPVPLVEYYGEIEPAKSAFLKDLFNFEDNLYLILFERLSSQKYVSRRTGEIIRYRRGSRQRFSDFANYLVNQEDKLKKFMTRTGAYNFGPDLDEGGRYFEYEDVLDREGNPTGRRIKTIARKGNPNTDQEIRHAIIFALEKNLDNDLKGEYDEYMKIVSNQPEGPDSEENMQFFLNFLYSLLEDGKDLNYLASYNFQPDAPDEDYEAVLNIFGFLNLFGEDTQSVIEIFEEAMQTIEARRTRLEARGRKVTNAGLVRFLQTKKEFADFSNRISEELQELILNTSRAIIKDMNTIFRSINIDDAMSKTSKYGLIRSGGRSRRRRTVGQILMDYDILRGVTE
tara:strand:+ start:436 stop:2187 length:1752 start_codon:yes stop_codon:yes gene_type:complete